MTSSSSAPSGLIDCHAHLGDGVFDGDRSAVIDRAIANGVAAVVVVGETLEDATSNLELAEQYPGFVWPTAGLYPTHLDPEQAERIAQLLRDRRDDFVAIGEVGLDHWVLKEPDQWDEQRRIFETFIALAIELDLPLNVHSRSAGRATLEVLTECGATRVLMHAFDGRAVKARPGVDAGYFFSVPPSIVRSAQKQKLIRQLPLECLVLETDSPVLGPDPETRNEPANVTISLETIARIKDLPIHEVARATTDNARRLFAR